MRFSYREIGTRLLRARLGKSHGIRGCFPSSDRRKRFFASLGKLLILEVVLAMLTAAQPLAAQDHVGHPIPKYVTGDECLFSHRVKVADTWQQNPQALTVHPNAEPAISKSNLPPEAE